MNRGVQIRLVLVYWTVMFCVCFGDLQQGYSRIQYGYRLNSRTINTYGEFSFLDCVEECLVTTRCKSVNYYKGANYCETNYEDKTSAQNKYLAQERCVYSERGDWPQLSRNLFITDPIGVVEYSNMNINGYGTPWIETYGNKELSGSCASANCSINQKCQHNKYSQNNTFHCILSDCGIPEKYGVDLDNTQQGAAIAINKGMHVKCSDGFEQFGYGRLVCRPSGEWDYNILCVEKEWLQNKYLDHVYFFSEESKNWNDAKADCESKDAYLVEIDSYEENKWIKSKIRDREPLNGAAEYAVFIGGFRKDKQRKEDFWWAGSNRSINYKKWRVGEPNNASGNEHCMQMFAAGEWDDNDCNNHFPYICEKTTIF